MSRSVEVVGNNNVICETSILTGNIIIGENNIFHPKCKIMSEGGGRIVIGDGNIFEETSQVLNW